MTLDEKIQILNNLRGGRRAGAVDLTFSFKVQISVVILLERLNFQRLLHSILFINKYHYIIFMIIFFIYFDFT
jgi:hypothetical protein